MKCNIYSDKLDNVVIVATESVSVLLPVTADRCVLFRAGISHHHLLQCRHQYLILLGPDADGGVRHSVVDAVYHGDDSH